MPVERTLPGHRTQVVSLLKPTTVKDRFGQHVVWNLVAKVYARVSPLTGREFLAAGAMQSPASVEVDIMWRGDIDGSWRLDWMNKHFELVAEPIDPEGRHDSLQLMCKSAPA